MYNFNYSEVSYQKCKYQSIKACQHVIKHASPATMYILVNTSTTKRFPDINNSKKHKANCCKGNRYIRRALAKQSCRCCHPCANILVNDNCPWIWSPIFFHHLISPCSQKQCDNDQSNCCNTQCRWR